MTFLKKTFQDISHNTPESVVQLQIESCSNTFTAFRGAIFKHATGRVAVAPKILQCMAVQSVHLELVKGRLSAKLFLDF